ncbi:MAG: oligopeptidase A [Myxococcales bacterium]|nr:oligopeptidase A [Myxococcales bacterium]
MIRRVLLAASFAAISQSCRPPEPAPIVGAPPATIVDAVVVPSSAPAAVVSPPLALVEPLAIATDAEGVRELCDDNLAHAKRIAAEVAKLDGAPPGTLRWEHTLARLDDVFLSISNASELPYLLGVVHPDEAVRNAAEECEKKTDEVETGLYLDERIAAVVRAFADERTQLSEERQRFLVQLLRELRRRGAELDLAGKARLRDVNQELTELGQRFIAEIGASTQSLEVLPAELRGMPDAWKQAHPPRENGKVTVTTDYPDYFPFVTYALDRNLARELFIKFTNRGGDANIGRLDRILALRHEKAKLFGYAHWADYATEPRMAKNAANAAAFLTRVRSAIEPAIAVELAEVRAEFKTAVRDPERAMIEPDRYFVNDRIKNQRYALDTKALAQFFEVEAVTTGLLAITAELYDLEYRPLEQVLWHATVKGYEVFSAGASIGKIYLDLAPRAHKYKHAAMFGIRTGKTLADGTRQTPIAALVCNFPAPGEPMPHEEVVTYFHEFGHVLHHILTETELASFAGTNTVRDFVEAPSQMFEEWAWSPEALARFARHRTTGVPLAAAMLESMARSRRFGVALHTERQLFLARLDLSYHTTTPPFDTTALLERTHDEEFSFRYVKGTHFQSSFGHLIGYDAGYYGYQWSLALAHDALGRFKKAGLFNKEVARAWRTQVLARGGSRDERTMLREFLGREPSEHAYAKFLSGN